MRCLSKARQSCNEILEALRQTILEEEEFTRSESEARHSSLTLKIPAPEKRLWTRSGSKPKIGGKSNFYHFLSENRLKNGLKTLQIAIIDGSLVLPRQLHRRYMVFSGRVHRPKTGPFHSKAGIYATKKCCNGADNLFKKFRMCPCRGYDHLFLEKSASSLALFQSRDPSLGGGVPCPSLVLQVSFNNDAHGHDEQ
jgi:hypothetical protein